MNTILTYGIVAGVSMIVTISISVVYSSIRKHTRAKKQVNQTGQLATNLQNERSKSDIILAAIDDAVIVLDDQKTVQLFNPAAERMTGWSAKEAVGLDYKIVLKLIDDKSEPLPMAKDPFLATYLNETTTHDNTIRLQSKDGSTLALDITISPVVNQELSVSGVVAVFRDVSEQRKEEAQRADFISTASHEMRTPVAAIEGYLALALNEKVCIVDQKARAFLEKAHESTQHLGNLFQDLLTSSKAEDGRLTNHPVVTELGDLLESLSDSLRFSAEKKSLSVEFGIGGQSRGIEVRGVNTLKPLYYANVDPDRIQEVVTNLFDNAVKYTDQGKVGISLTGDESIIQIRVSDTGHGIPAADVPHLFQKFYRVDNTATRTVGGTGLGLFICRKIVELYGGKIWLESQLEKGTTFFINLPRLSTPQAQSLLEQQMMTAKQSNDLQQPTVTPIVNGTAAPTTPPITPQV
jgi:PAS domain S-box-containing protein